MTTIQAHLLTEHLREKGHRRIEYIGAVAHDMDRHWIRTRYAGFIDTTHELNCDVRPEWILRVHPDKDPFHQEDLKFEETFRKAMTGSERPTAWVCHADEYAQRGILQASQLGLRVPEDVSFAGFDNTPFSRFTTPPLTTIGFNIQTIVDHCLQRIDAPAQPGDIFRTMIDPVLHKRGSVADIS